jgi:cell division protein FtsW
MTKASSDQLFFIGISVLVLFGLPMIYSASIVVAGQKGPPSSYFVRQSIYAGAGYLLMLLLVFVDYHVWLKQRTIILLAAISLFGLLLVFTQPPIKGAQRGLGIGSLVSIQPSEMAKLVLLFYLAFFLEKHHQELKQPGRPMVRCLIFMGIFIALIGVEPDLGQALCIIIVTTILFFVAGLNWKYIGFAILLSIPSFYFFVWKVHFRHARILAWIAAIQDPLNANYHIRHAAFAFGRGGLWGVGFGESREKFLFLPEATTDFIYAVIGEELGWMGAILVLAAFLGFLYWGVRISLKAPDRGGQYLGLGITMMVTLQAFINISSALAIIPTKGLTLPFISRGGSSLLASLIAAGILLNISSQRKTKIE